MSESINGREVCSAPVRNQSKLTRLYFVRNSRFSTSNQNSSNDNEMMTYDLHSCPPSMRTACELRICSSIHGVRNSRFSTSNPNIYEAERQTKSSRLGKVHTSSWLCFQFMEGKERAIRSNGTCTDSAFVEILLHRSAEVQAEARN